MTSVDKASHCRDLPWFEEESGEDLIWQSLLCNLRRDLIWFWWIFFGVLGPQMATWLFSTWFLQPLGPVKANTSCISSILLESKGTTWLFCPCFHLWAHLSHLSFSNIKSWLGWAGTQQAFFPTGGSFWPSFPLLVWQIVGADPYLSGCGDNSVQPHPGRQLSLQRCSAGWEQVAGTSWAGRWQGWVQGFRLNKNQC